MASIFLSYAREDAAKAKRIAEALEAAGHSVWWDRQLHAGERFSAEINQALKNADLVVVLWSSSSVDSPWVHDEAAVGRDTRRLIPVLIEQVEPPLGFRQYHAVDLSSRRGRGQFQPLVEALSAKAGVRPADVPKPTERLHLPRRTWLSAAVVAIVALLAVAAWQLWPRGSSAPPTIQIAAAQGSNPSSRELAQSIALDLGRYQTGPVGFLNIVNGGQSKARNADYRVEVRASKASAGLAGDLILLKRGQPKILWSGSVALPAGAMVDLRQQAVSKLVGVLGCLNETQGRRARISQEALALYLKGCGMLGDVVTDEPSEEVLSTFRQLTTKAPDFAPGWANLALLEVQSWPSTPPREHPALMRSSRQHLARAKQIDPSNPVAFAADASLPEHAQRPEKSLAILDEGLKRHPDNALLHSLRSDSLAFAGRTGESLSEALNAMQLNPLSPAYRERYVSGLAYAGQTAKAFNELQKAEAIWPGSEVLREVRHRLYLRYGDPRTALRFLQEEGAVDVRPVPMDTAWQAFIKARIDPNPANVEKALDAFRARYRRNPGDNWGYLQALGTFGRVDEAFQALEPAEAMDGASATPDTFFRVHMWPILSDPRFIRVAHRLGLLRYWKMSGNWPDFCRDPQLPYDCHEEAKKYPPEPPPP